MNALTHILSKIRYEEDLARSRVKLPKRQERDYKESDYPFTVIPEVF